MIRSSFLKVIYFTYYKAMTKSIPLVLAIILLSNVLYSQKMPPLFCMSTSNYSLCTDVYILLPDEFEGQLLTGQFCRIAGNLEKAAMTVEEMNEFMEKEDKSLIKYFGDAFLVLKKDKKYFLAEVIRNEDDSFEPVKFVPIDKTLVNFSTFLNIIIPRK